MKIALVVPAYNEENNIANTLRGLKRTKLPIIVVDDGSKDNTHTIAQKHATYSLKHKINLGKGSAMKTGAVYAFKQGYDAIIYFDADGQHDANDMPQFVKKLKKGYGVVLGSRAYTQDAPFVRYMGNKFASVLVSILFGIYVSDLICGYRAITKKAYKELSWESIGYGVETEMVIRLSKTKLKWTEVPVKTIYIDKVKGVTLLDAMSILFQVILLRLKL